MNYSTTSYELRLNFVRTLGEVRKEQTSHGNIIFAPTVLPMNKSEIKDTAPMGVLAIRNLAVLWCLYDDHVELC